MVNLHCSPLSVISYTYSKSVDAVALLSQESVPLAVELVTTSRSW